MFLPCEGFSRDRTGDFNLLKGSDRSVRVSRAETSSDSTYLISPDPQIADSPLEPFFALSRSVRAEIESLRVAFSSLQSAQQRCLRPTFSDANDEISAVDTLTSNISSRLRRVGDEIRLLDAPAVISRGPLASEVVRNIRAALAAEFAEFNSLFRANAQSFGASSRLLRPADASDAVRDEIDFSTFNFGESRSAAMERQVDQSSQQIEELARRSAQVREIFVDLSNLVLEQGTIVNRIDFNIASSLENAKAANEEVEKALSYQKKSRMWIVVVILAAFVVLLIIILILK